VVEQVFTNDGGATAVEIDGGNIRRIIGNEEVAIDTGEYSQKHGTFDA